MPSFDRPAATGLAPSPWVTRFAPLIPAVGQVLDLACGDGRHLRYLLGLGYRVAGADLDVSGLADLGGDSRVEILPVDLETGCWPFAGRTFAGIVVANYLHRPHFAWLPDALMDGGVLMFDTFGQGNERFGRPRNPEFLLAPGELLTALAGRLQVVAYENGIEQLPRPAVRQRLCAIRRKDPVPLPGVAPS